MKTVKESDAVVLFCDVQDGGGIVHSNSWIFKKPSGQIKKLCQIHCEHFENWTNTNTGGFLSLVPSYSVSWSVNDFKNVRSFRLVSP